jgi:hypothetical protein
MQSSDLPTKLQTPFAVNAGGPYIRTIPVASQIGIVDGAASYNDGFPPLNFLTEGAGGVNPFGQDMNGILKELSAMLWWYSAGAPITYDSAFQTAIGGYPKGAVLHSASVAGLFWRSTTENNVTNPDTGGAGWVVNVQGLRQNIQSANYTTKLLDANGEILHPTADNTARVFTIDSNANVPQEIGTTLTFVNQINTLTIAITSDTLTWAGLGLTGSRTLNSSGMATALKVEATKWVINGVGMT